MALQHRYRTKKWRPNPGQPTSFVLYAKIMKQGSPGSEDKYRCAYIGLRDGDVHRHPSGIPYIYLGPEVDRKQACISNTNDASLAKGIQPVEFIFSKVWNIHRPDYLQFPPYFSASEEEITDGIRLAFGPMDSFRLHVPERKKAEYREVTAAVAEEQARKDAERALTPAQTAERLGLNAVNNRSWTQLRRDVKNSFDAGTKDYQTVAEVLNTEFINFADFKPLNENGSVPEDPFNNVDEDDAIEYIEVATKELKDLIRKTENRRMTKPKKAARLAVIHAALTDALLRSPTRTASILAEARASWDMARSGLTNTNILPIEVALINELAPASYGDLNVFRDRTKGVPAPVDPKREASRLESELKARKSAWKKAMDTVNEKGVAVLDHSIVESITREGYEVGYSRAALENKIAHIRVRLRAETIERRKSAITDMITLFKSKAGYLMGYVMNVDKKAPIVGNALLFMKQVWRDLWSYLVWSSNVVDLFRVAGPAGDAEINAMTTVGPPSSEYKYTTGFTPKGVFKYSADKVTTSDDQYMSLFTRIYTMTEEVEANIIDVYFGINEELYVTREQMSEAQRRQYAALREKKDARLRAWREQQEKKGADKRQKKSTAEEADVDFDLDDIDLGIGPAPSPAAAKPKGPPMGSSAAEKAEAAAAAAPAADEDIFADFELNNPRKKRAAVRNPRRQNPTPRGSWHWA